MELLGGPLGEEGLRLLRAVAVAQVVSRRGEPLPEAARFGDERVYEVPRRARGGGRRAGGAGGHRLDRAARSSTSARCGRSTASCSRSPTRRGSRSRTWPRRSTAWPGSSSTRGPAWPTPPCPCCAIPEGDGAPSSSRAAKRATCAWARGCPRGAGVLEVGAVKVHLVDGTFELFRAYFGAPPATGPTGAPVGAVRGLVRSMLSLLGEGGVTHVAVAFDHVIESFRNRLFAGYKTGEGIDRRPPRAVPSRRGRGARPGRRGVAHGRVRGRRRPGHRRARASPRTRRSSRWWCARPTRTWPSACAGRASSPSTACARGPSTRRGWWRSSACRPPPFPTGSPSWATTPTASPASRAGASARPPPCSARYRRLEDIPDQEPAGTSRCAALRPWPRACARTARRSCSIAPWPPCARTCPCAEDLEALRYRGAARAADRGRRLESLLTRGGPDHPWQVRMRRRARG